MTKWIWIAAVLLITMNIYAANATDYSKFHLWLKCKAIELYINVTGANYTLPQCDLYNLTLPNATFIIGRAGVAPLPMIGIGELKKLNVTDPRQVFWEIKRIRKEALEKLNEYVNRSISNIYRDLNISKGLDRAINATEHGYASLKNVAELLRRVNASGVAVAALERNTYWLNFTRHVLREISMGNFTERWIRDRIRNGTIEEIDKALDEVEKLKERIRSLMDHFEKVKAVGLLKIISSLYDQDVNQTITILKDIRERVKIGAGREIIEAIKRGDIGIRNAIRNVEKNIPKDTNEARGAKDNNRDKDNTPVEPGRGAADRGRGNR
ncbi:MAG: hypothetical protein QW049_00930 [Pyrobaculum sp.]